MDHQDSFGDFLWGLLVVAAFVVVLFIALHETNPTTTVRWVHHPIHPGMNVYGPWPDRQIVKGK